MSDVKSELPAGWVWTTLEEISEINPRIDKQSIDENLEVTFLPMKCVEKMTGKIDLSIIRKFSEVKKGYTPFGNEDILFAKVTPCMENGKIAVAHDLKNGIGFGSTEFHVVRLPKYLSRQFYFFYLLQEGFRREAQRAMTSGIGLLRVPTNYMKQVPVPLPPLPEQHRIVAKIEELLTQLDAGVAALKQAQAQLKRYRQSVLKATVEGELTKAWREAHQDEVEPVSVLLERILKERRERWEAEQLAKMEAKGKPPKDDKWKAKYKEPVAPDTKDLPELPEGWYWASLESLLRTDNLSYGILKPGDYDEHGVLMLRIMDIGDGKLNNTDIFRVSPSLADQYKRTQLEAGDLILAVMATVGRAIIVPPHLEGSNVNRALAVIKLSRVVNPAFICVCIMSPYLQDIFAERKIGSAQPRINLSDLRTFAFPLPPLTEQHAIVEEVERCLSIADEVKATIEAELKRADRLRQSILKDAFSGKLVSQDPDDEPASILLERIKADKAQR